MGSELLAKFDGEPFQRNSSREVEVLVNASGTVIIAVRTLWPGNNDRSMICLSPDELERVNRMVNGD